MQTIKRTSLLLAGMLASASGWAATPAGTEVKNTATATYYSPTDSVNQISVDSNEAKFKVDEVIDVSITALNGTNVITDQQDVAVKYEINNDGNGSENFKVTAINAATGDDFDVSGIKIYFDADGDGKFTAADLASEYNDALGLNMNAGSSTIIFVVADVPTVAVGEKADFNLTVTSQTPGASGSGAAGKVLAGQGDGGTAAIVAKDDAASTFTHTYTVVLDPNAPATAVTVVKSVLQHVDSFNTGKPIPGAVTTYQILVTVHSAVESLIISDPIPANLTYVPNSVYMVASDQVGNDLSATETALNDATVFLPTADTHGRVAIDMGNQATAGVYTIQFNVTIN